MSDLDREYHNGAFDMLRLSWTGDRNDPTFKTNLKNCAALTGRPEEMLVLPLEAKSARKEKPSKK